MATAPSTAFPAAPGSRHAISSSSNSGSSSSSSSLWLGQAGLDLASGVAGAAALTLVGAPFDRLKTLAQTARVPPPPRGGGGGGGGGASSLLASLVRAHGVRTLWRGAAPALLSAVLENGVAFAFAGGARRLLAAQERGALTVGASAAVGALGGVVSAAVICPAEVIKVRMAAAAAAAAADGGGSGRYPGMLATAAALLRAEGLRGAFSGLTALWARDIPFNAVFFGAYRASCALLCAAAGHRATPAHDAMPGWVAAAAGSAAGVLAWAVVYPFDLCKSRAQLGGGGAPPAPLLGALRGIVRAGGVRALYVGAAPALARGGVGNAALFYGQNAALRLLGGCEAEEALR